MKRNILMKTFVLALAARYQRSFSELYQMHAK